jgi:hypothetical protein
MRRRVAAETYLREHEHVASSTAIVLAVNEQMTVESEHESITPDLHVHEIQAVPD